MYVQEAQTYAEDTGLLFMETSAKTAMNVNELFLAIGECWICLLTSVSCTGYWFYSEAILSVKALSYFDSDLQLSSLWQTFF